MKYFVTNIIFLYIWANFLQGTMITFLRDLSGLIKMRADLVVALTAMLGLALGTGTWPAFSKMLFIFTGGFLVTATAHILNQIFERKHDRKMLRTMNRPLASGRWPVYKALSIAVFFSVTGLIMLYYGVHPLAALISFVSLLLYAFVYTPLKRKTRLAIPVGAIPGALPILIGYAGATGAVDSFAFLLFLFQVLWQFPHFWAIAWVWHDEYEKGGYDLMPSAGGRNNRNAIIIFLSVFALFPLLHLLYAWNFLGKAVYFLSLLLSTWFVYVGWKFFKGRERKDAQNLMKASIIYLPLILFLILIDKI